MDEPKKPEVESPSPEKLTESDLSQVVGGSQVVGETFYKVDATGNQIKTGTLTPAEKPIIGGE
jgi:hypothetical protein